MPKQKLSIPPPMAPALNTPGMMTELGSWGSQDPKVYQTPVPQNKFQVQPQMQEMVLWSPERLELLKKTIAKDLTNDEFALFAEICKRRKLDPFAKQIYPVKRQGTLVIQTSIDGYRLIAERTGKYLGQTAPYWCGTDATFKEVWTGPGNPFACKVGVYKDGMPEPTWAIGYWETYYSPYGPFWKKAGASMLAKCTEALALRKAFPEELSGLYTEEEMEQAGSSALEAVVIQPDTSQPQSAYVIVAKVESMFTTPDGTPSAVISDIQGQEWIFSGQDIEKAQLAMESQQSGLLVTYIVDTGRYIVTECANG